MPFYIISYYIYDSNIMTAKMPNRVGLNKKKAIAFSKNRKKLLKIKNKQHF